MISPTGSMIDREAEFLNNTLGKGKIIVEVGCYIGKTTCVLAENNLVIGIDPFLSDYDPKDPTIQNMEGVENVFRETIKGKNVIWFKEKSEQVLDKWNMLIDGIFIDGSHTTEALNIDIKWVDYVKTGGIMAFHDYGCWPDVTAFLNKHIIPKYKEIGRKRFLIIFRK